MIELLLLTGAAMVGGVFIATPDDDVADQIADPSPDEAQDIVEPPLELAASDNDTSPLSFVGPEEAALPPLDLAQYAVTDVESLIDDSPAKFVFGSSGADIVDAFGAAGPVAVQPFDAPTVEETGLPEIADYTPGSDELELYYDPLGQAPTIANLDLQYDAVEGGSVLLLSGEPAVFLRNIIPEDVDLSSVKLTPDADAAPVAQTALAAE